MLTIRLALVIPLLAAFNVAQADTEIQSLSAAVDGGNVRIVSVHGNGSSSGPALHGYLWRVDSAEEERISVQLDKPLFFRNEGAGQNMIATQVYARSMQYWSNGNEKWLSLPAGESMTPITFIAYCADLGKDNPSSEELLSPAGLPQDLERVSAQIAAYERVYPDESTSLPQQLALWRAQGESWEQISNYLRFTSEDRVRAEQILGLVVD